ncbi:uncharacterized protein LOC111084469 [Limulus polyphemus]|uniref:Uncharacterized protein LOC111084469 n=1 Tax=Limulus polyphemus TaxID=6850 RepID=A0ABM1RZT7_LIMPO|nr:uncharacterized protein LOC111084469 [Limulus polyphemus]
MVIVLCRCRKFQWRKKAFRLCPPLHQNKGLILVCPHLILRRNVLISHVCPLLNLSLSLDSRIFRNLSQKVDNVKKEEYERIFIVRNLAGLWTSRNLNRSRR